MDDCDLSEMRDALLAQTGRLLRSLAAPELAPILAAWPPAAQPRAVEPCALPVLRWLTEAAADAPGFSEAVVRSLSRAAPSLAWHQTYAMGDVGADFLENYGWSELIGTRGPIPSKQIACGWLLLGPDTLYPRHRHEAAEIYLPLTGTAAWQQGDGVWREKPPGELIHHGSNEPHAMRTGARPLLALYVWCGADLSQKASLDPERID